MVVVEGIIDTVVVVVVTWHHHRRHGSHYHGDTGSTALSSSLGRDGGVVTLQWCYSLRHIVIVTSVIDRKEGPGYGGGHNQNVVVVAVIIVAVVAVVLWWYGPGHGNLSKVLPRVEVVWVTRLPWGLDEIFNLILYCTHTISLNSTSVNFYGVTV